MSAPGESRRRVVVVLACLATSVLVSATAYLCAWRAFVNSRDRFHEYYTRLELGRLRAEVEEHKERTGHWPERLTELDGVKKKRLHVDEKGEPVDDWGRPFEYRVEDGTYVLDQAPRDAGPEPRDPAKPGGDRPTLWQFSHRSDAVPALAASILAGVVAFPVCLQDARKRDGRPPSYARALVANAVTAVFAIFAALVMYAVHIVPGGH